MNDRFKFRAWCLPMRSKNEVKGHLIYCDENDLSYFWDMIELGDSPIMQCTGLKDKNGKLIFEGDILQDLEGNKVFIKWEDRNYICGFCTIPISKLKNMIYSKAMSMQGGIDGDEISDIIIGNIWENPELLNQK